MRLEEHSRTFIA